ncbi:hypothetical protein [Microbacterium sp. TNHR37B]|uniref:hypothetical protein n=1 Tax=Microbacterium sp. TNHR37B TaxID=1775956 RepID=UPI0007B303A5|nr:hypothetical protein [Microbacterium sp. TNHR37B]KZE89359.1 hypothetical protein AVP41_02153 [Microbacterium sp. TNHR37B]
MGADDDAVLFHALRRTWEEIDPMPADLVDRMVASVATADLSREYALLTLVSQTELAAVRGDADALTLQFSDGTASVLVHVVAAADGRRRVDGWIDAAAVSVEIEQDEHTWSAVPEHGRFAFDDVPSGMTRLRIVLEETTEAGTPAELHTPRFEV